MKRPLVTIGIPVYNNARHVRETVRSIFNQSYKNIEIIISDDCSADSTPSICAAISSKHRRVSFYRQYRRLGTPGNFNFCLKKARGRFFLWAAGDDWRDQDCIDALLTPMLTDRQIVLSISRMELSDGKNRKAVTLPLPPVSSGSDAVRYLLTHPESVAQFVLGLYRTETLRTNGGYHGDRRPVFQGASDLLTSLKVLRSGKLHYTDATTLHKRDSGYYLSKYAVLYSGIVTPVFFRRTLRYLLFPVMFLFDLWYSVVFISRSPFPLQERVNLILLSIRLFIVHMLRFITTVTLGFLMLIAGAVRRAVTKITGQSLRFIGS